MYYPARQMLGLLLIVICSGLSAIVIKTLLLFFELTSTKPVGKKVKGKGKCIAVRKNTYTATGNHLLYGITHTGK